MTKFHTVVFSFVASIFAAATPAQAQYQTQYYGPYYAPQPRYPYVVAPQPYAQVQAYPYVIQRELQNVPRADYRKHIRRGHADAGKTDPALVQELRTRAAKRGRRPNIDKTVIVREKPVVIEKKHYVDDPPVVVQRHHVVDVPAASAEPPARQRGQPVRGAGNPGPNNINHNRTGRVIRAEAEVTILGPDRMSIRLFRRRGGLDANAKAE